MLLVNVLCQLPAHAGKIQQPCQMDEHQLELARLEKRTSYGQAASAGDEMKGDRRQGGAVAKAKERRKATYR